MTRKQKKLLQRILAAGVLFTAGMLLPYLLPGGLFLPRLELAVFAVCYLLIGWDIVWRAVCNIREGEVFDENFLMALASLGAFLLGDYSEGAAVMLFYQVGEWFQSYAVDKSRRSISKLMDIRPDYANVERAGQLVQVDPDQVALGEIITVRPGERVPLDGQVVGGHSFLDTSALTGESLPREVEPGVEVISGCINQNGLLQIKTTKLFGESTVAKILDLVENSSAKKARTEAFITRFARYYTPAVVIGACLLAVVPPLVNGGDFNTWVYRALTFLVISCPCALVISIPLSFFGGIGGASRCGILVKGSNYLEALAATEVVVFDKTGTLTKGSFAVTAVRPAQGSADRLLELAAYAEEASNHPISRSVKQAYGRPIDRTRISKVEELAGRGLRTVVAGRTVLAGNAKLLREAGVAFTPEEEAGTVIYLAVDNRYAGSILIEDELKADTTAALAALKEAGVRKAVMLTGDSFSVGQKVGTRLGLDEVYAELLPGDKVAKLEELLTALQRRNPKAKLAFVGDGINDAPVLARADVGIAMGALGSDAAIEAADVVLMTDEPSKIATVMQIARKTLGIAYQNIIFAIGVKLIILILGALGLASMWAAVFADVGVAFLAILNAMRALQVRQLAPQNNYRCLLT